MALANTQSSGEPARPARAQVINIATPSFEVKNLVYIYLVRYAEHRPDEALLAVNSFQKDLAHPNPRVRALALRVLSSIRVHVIVPVVVLSLLLSFVATLYPSWRASRVNPAEALRYD